VGGGGGEEVGGWRGGGGREWVKGGGGREGGEGQERKRVEHESHFWSSVIYFQQIAKVLQRVLIVQNNN